MRLREHAALPTKRGGESAPRNEIRPPAALGRRDRLGGTDGNEVLTSATAAVLTVLLVAEGITILRIGGLISAHMFIGLVLIPPVLLKLASTGYRFVRYYTGAGAYREKGPPPLPLRLLAPVLVAATAGVFVTGVLLLLLGHRSDQLLLLHKITFVIWGVVFAVHFLAHLPRVIRILGPDRGAARRRAVARAGARGTLVAASLGAGIALALSLLGAIAGWQTGHPN
ncbi:MAG: hypothetical protein ACRDLL_06800 [Solirubrobacterales bacterium]